MKSPEDYTITEPMSAFEIIKERLIPLILEDYQRMRMGTWLKHNDPICGTVGCIAGWSIYITKMPIFVNFSETGVKLVPPHLRTEFRRAFMSGHHFYQEDGTKTQVDAVVKFLEGFCKEHEKDLRCWIIDPTSSGLGSDPIDPYTGKEKQSE